MIFFLMLQGIFSVGDSGLPYFAFRKSGYDLVLCCRHHDGSKVKIEMK